MCDIASDGWKVVTVRLLVIHYVHGMHCSVVSKSSVNEQLTSWQVVLSDNLHTWIKLCQNKDTFNIVIRMFWSPSLQLLSAVYLGKETHHFWQLDSEQYKLRKANVMTLLHACTKEKVESLHHDHNKANSYVTRVCSFICTGRQVRSCRSDWWCWCERLL